MPVTKRAAKRPPAPKVVNPRLKAYLDATKNESVILGPLDRYLQLLPNDRDPSVIHPSEMSSKAWCHRATWLRLTGHLLRKHSPLTLRPNLIFSEGHLIHEKWQGWLRDMGVLWGDWKCLVCDLRVRGYSDEIGSVCPAISPTIGGARKPHLWKYMEVPLGEPLLRIGGHADGVVNMTGDEPFLLEVKSIGPGTIRLLDLLAEHEADDISSDRFSKITRPMNSHFMQTQLYLRLLEEHRTDVGEVKRAVVVYEHKSDQQVREFVVTRNDKWTDPLFDAAADIVWAIDKGREVKCNHGGCALCNAYVED
jgi:hypothetical protein